VEHTGAFPNPDGKRTDFLRGAGARALFFDHWRRPQRFGISKLSDKDFPSSLHVAVWGLASPHMLEEFLADNRDEILARARMRVAQRNAPAPTEAELTHGLPIFFDQLRAALVRAATHKSVDHAEIDKSASQHGHDLFNRGVTVAQVVHDYGDLCQVITALASEQKAPIGTAEFQTLNLCLDDAIAGAATEYVRHRERVITDEGTERLGILAHEMRNLLNTALMSFRSIKSGIVAPGGSTSAMHERTLIRLVALVDRSMADVRLDAGLQKLEQVPLCEVIEEVEIAAAYVAEKRGLRFEVTTVDRSVIVEADRQILAATLANLLQNALKFTRKGTAVYLRASSTETRVLIDIEDECGGLPPGQAENLLQPFIQRGRDRSGLGLGLAICLKAVKAIGGDLRIRDLPGKGCVFTVDLPKQPPPPSSIHARRPKSSNEPEGTGGASARAV
jgi:signal transduction histidine kinase